MPVDGLVFIYARTNDIFDRTKARNLFNDRLLFLACHFNSERL